MRKWVKYGLLLGAVFCIGFWFGYTRKQQDIKGYTQNIKVNNTNKSVRVIEKIRVGKRKQTIILTITNFQKITNSQTNLIVITNSIPLRIETDIKTPFWGAGIGYGTEGIELYGERFLIGYRNYELWLGVSIGYKRINVFGLVRF